MRKRADMQYKDYKDLQSEDVSLNLVFSSSKDPRYLGILRFLCGRKRMLTYLLPKTVLMSKLRWQSVRLALQQAGKAAPTARWSLVRAPAALLLI